jgi:hypothetical protein
VQDDSSLGSGHFLLALFALCLLALLVFASAASAQQTAGPGGETTAETTSAASPSAASPPATASPEVTSSADELTADVPRDADEFRCNFFLHEVRDVQGNVRRQYQDLNTRRSPPQADYLYSCWVSRLSRLSGRGFCWREGSRVRSLWVTRPSRRKDPRGAVERRRSRPIDFAGSLETRFLRGGTARKIRHFARRWGFSESHGRCQDHRQRQSQHRPLSHLLSYHTHRHLASIRGNGPLRFTTNLMMARARGWHIGRRMSSFLGL